MSNVVGKAIFTSYSRDIFWTFYTEATGKLMWTGYDDANWWENVATKTSFTDKHAKDNKTYTLNPETNAITSRPTVKI